MTDIINKINEYLDQLNFEDIFSSKDILNYLLKEKTKYNSTDIFNGIIHSLSKRSDIVRIFTIKDENDKIIHHYNNINDVPIQYHNFKCIPAYKKI